VPDPASKREAAMFKNLLIAMDLSPASIWL
jgi:hypothetical protein